MEPQVLLINTNVTRPPVSPVGLEYVGEALIEAGVPVQILDLSFETDWRASLASELKRDDPLIVGLSVRNTDDCSFVSRKSFLPWIRDVVAEVKKMTRAPVFLGGVGFSTMPEAVLEATQADGGIEGDGEEALQALVKCLAGREDFVGVPNTVYWCNGDIVRNPRADVDLCRLPVPRRRLFDNRKYEQLGAMVGIETKRGCSERCIFCADPVAKGRRVRLRPPLTVVREFQDLLAQGVSWFHICDSEFNLPLSHAKEACRALFEARLGDKLRWYTYCSPTPFDRELAGLMKRAGCAGINFGVDSLYDEQLSRLGRTHTTSDIRELVQILRKEQLNYMFDLLVGGPGETPDTVKATINRVKEFDVPLAGIATGVRVYPHTPLAKWIADRTIEGALYPDTMDVSYQPLFYLSALLGSNPLALIGEFVADDPRFLLLSAPPEKGSYNYADDQWLCQAIEQGARGAYWDIISRSRRINKEGKAT